MHKLIITAIAMALLSGCAANNPANDAVNTPAVTDAPAFSEDVTAPTTTEAPQVTSNTQATTYEDITTSASSSETEEVTTEATTETTTEATEEVTTAESAESEPESTTTEAEEEIITESEDEEVIPEESETEDVYGTTSEGEEFVIDPDYAFFIVNKQLPLSEDYSIETDYVQGSYELETTAAYYCRLMIEAAKEDGIELKVLSAYRTVKYQKRLFERNVESRMEDGMSYDEAYADVSINIAPPGASEHNAGLAVDIITMDDWDTYEGFEDTEEFAWLQENAADFGFIMRYLKGKEDITGYIYEPWHYRYVGIKYARDVRDSGLCLEEYFEKYVDPMG